MRSYLWNVVGIMTVAAAASPSECSAAVLEGPVLNPANGHLYYLLTTGTWSDREAEATSLDGHLVSINDASENEWVYTRFGEPLGRSLWTGLNDAASEGTFVWSDGSLLAGYTNWARALNTINDDVVDYVYTLPYRPAEGGEWSIAAAGNTTFGVAEVVPEPSSLAGVVSAAVGLIRRRRGQEPRMNADARR